ncbi:hypothetical protein CEXT_287631 [Caerostris extrusa]|uniref:Uncharacterized protein n=1 Tax=Caerostris extrusa TaxID=172846 RepID=A0AAV4Q6U6_CAEEX|nr:hypothetical protein CEXT_287631 [Caerostris extrusa]
MKCPVVSKGHTHGGGCLFEKRDVSKKWLFQHAVPVTPPNNALHLLSTLPERDSLLNALGGPVWVAFNHSKLDRVALMGRREESVQPTQSRDYWLPGGWDICIHTPFAFFRSFLDFSFGFFDL